MLTRLYTQPNVPNAPQAGGAVVQAGASAYTTQARATASQFATLPDLQRRIMEFLSEQPQQSTSEGVHVSAIVRGVSSSGGANMDATKIRYANSPIDTGLVLNFNTAKPSTLLWMTVGLVRFCFRIYTQLHQSRSRLHDYRRVPFPNFYLILLLHDTFLKIS